jgi:ubiquinone biosynthesis protein Coq4
MWNLSKIFKTTHFLMTTYGEDGLGAAQNADFNGQHRLDHIVNMYREMNVPFGAIMAAANRKSKAGRDILWARNGFEAENIEKVVVPTLMDFDYLISLAPNTVGAHYYNLVKDWGIEDLYNQRFKHEEADPERFDQEIRVNLSRHLLLIHDFWHVLFRYDTATMGEAMIQEVTAHLSNFHPPRLVSFFGTWKMARKLKSNLPWKVRKECKQLCKQVDKRLFFQSPLSLLERDIEEVRKEYSIGVPVVYKQFVEEFGAQGESRLDTFHPQYKDVEWDTTEVTV